MYAGVSCKFDGCDKQATSLDLCPGHYNQQRRGDALRPLGERIGKVYGPCQVDGCDRPGNRKGSCRIHYWRMIRTGTTDPPTRVVRSKDGERIDLDTGYVMVRRPGHPEAKKAGWGYEHRIVMSDLLGRPLYRDENVHHRSGVKHDNSPENLELWSRWQPSGQRVVDKVAYAKDLLARYAPEYLARAAARVPRQRTAVTSPKAEPVTTLF